LPNFHKIFLDENKREFFLEQIRSLDYYGFDFSNTTELFSGVLAAYIQTVYPENIKIDSLTEDEEFLLFCRDQLGVFKAEAGLFFQAMNLINPLKNFSYSSKL
jgi:poly(A) polymerase